MIGFIILILASAGLYLLNCLFNILFLGTIGLGLTTLVNKMSEWLKWLKNNWN
jgi:septin family protein